MAALASAAFGTAIGAIARDVASASLLAFTLLIPVAFLALVPSGVVSPFVYDVTRVVSALFPFDPTVDAMNAALYGDGRLLVPLLHLASLGLVYGIAARFAVRKFA